MGNGQVVGMRRMKNEIIEKIDEWRGERRRRRKTVQSCQESGRDKLVAASDDGQYLMVDGRIDLLSHHATFSTKNATAGRFDSTRKSTAQDKLKSGLFGGNDLTDLGTGIADNLDYSCCCS